MNLGGANLKDTVLRLTNFSGADLTGARGITQEQLDRACGDGATGLPANLSIGICP